MTRIGAAFSLLLAGAALPAPLAAAVPDGAASPEELVARMKAAVEGDDVNEMVACIAPADRATFAVVLVAAAGIVVSFAEMGAGTAEAPREGDPEEAPDPDLARARAEAVAMRQDYEALLERYGLGAIPEDALEDPAAAAKLVAGVDHGRLIGDVLAFLDEHAGGPAAGAADDAPGEDAGGTSPFEPSDFDLSKLVIEGDRARIEGSEDMRFVRVGARWFVALPESALELPGASIPGD